ncbi:ATP-binding cassette transporter snq2 [Rhodotorula kratochvilovae]
MLYPAVPRTAAEAAPPAPDDDRPIATDARDAAGVPDSSASSSMTVNGSNAREHVDSEKAAAEFENLRRSLSRHSSHYPQPSDLEKQDPSSSSFDLLSYLRAEASEAEAAGFKRKALGVAWNKLQVVGNGGEKPAEPVPLVMQLFIPTFLDACRDWVLWPVHKAGQLCGLGKTHPKDLLHKFDGCLKPGEMCLVIGRPGSGCTTFLKTIANQRSGYLAVNGDVSYGGIPASLMSKRYRGEVVYNQEDDVHAATLTVAQTLGFALKLKTPGKLPPGKTKSDLEDEVLEVVLRMLGISHTKNTKVGSAHERGVSGGERKRVSIAEMMATRACVCSWDNSTRGLDASTALDYAKALRVLTDVHQMATFVSLYQAGEGIYDQFDKVLVIDEGRQVYFGPASEARQYMMSLGYADLPRQTSADYLTGCTDPNERKLARGRSEADVPSTSEALEAAFQRSDICARMVAERDAYLAQCERDEQARREFEEAVRSDKRKGVSGKSVYTASFFAQVWALSVRQFQLRLQNRADLIFLYSSNIAISLIIGSVFYQLPQSAAGAFRRGGAIFLGVIFNGFQAFTELPSQMHGRPIVWKHKSWALYRPGATTVAATLADLPINVLTIFLFSLILYFMIGLTYDAGAFFSYYLIVLTTFLATSAWFRLFGTLCRNYDQANRYVSAIVTIFELYSGYLIPLFAQKRWLFWFSYLSPFQYGYAAAMSNEFKRLSLLCDGSYIFPNSLDGLLPQYPMSLGPNQVCTVAGAMPGSDIIPGRDYLAAAYGYEISEQWRNWGILVCFFFGISIIQAVLAEVIPDGDSAPHIDIFAHENKERQELNERLQCNKDAYRKGEVEQDLSGLIQTRKAFTWEDLTYTVPVPGGHRQLLDHVFGYVKPGEITALMGASGAGKTTLLDVLADRKTIGVVGGSRLVAGRPCGREFQRGTAYVEQQDVHEHTATVREAFRFSAYLRQSAEISKEDKDRYVEEVIQLLELEDKADAMIGEVGHGLDVEARKRVTIGVELSAKPQLLLFLDEPTSGLDGQSAYNIVRFLRKLAAAGQAILVTIHQPNALLFENFDRLLLLKRGGRTVYFGDIGKDSHVLRDYLGKNGAACPEDANPAEFMLEAIGAGSSKQIGDKDWADIWNDSDEFSAVKQEIERIKEDGLATPEDLDPSLHLEFATSFAYQLKVVSQRTLLAFYRSVDYGWTRFFNHICLSLTIGLTYLQLGKSQQDMQYRLFALFYLVTLPAILIAQVEPLFIHNRSTFVRESSSKMYSPVVFGLTQLIGEMPYSLICAVAFFLLFYYPIGLDYASSRAGYHFAFVLLLEVYSVTLGQMFAALSPTEYIAEQMVPGALLIFVTFCGVTVTYKEMLGFWRFLYRVNPFTYVVEGTMVNEMHGLAITCTPRELRVFNPPEGQTCAEWAGAFLRASTGYLTNPDATSSCEYCQYANGDEFASTYGWEWRNRGRDIGIFAAFVLFNCAVTVTASKWLRYAKR